MAGINILIQIFTSFMSCLIIKSFLDALFIRRTIKNKTIFRNVINCDRLMPGQATKLIKKSVTSYNQNINTALVYIFSIKPSKKIESDKDPFDTNTKYCYYDQTHDDYQYTNEWVEFVISLFNNNKISIPKVNELYRNRKKIDISEYE